jgi:RNA polymerase primary sigma factor
MGGIDTKKVGSFITSTQSVKAYFNEIRGTAKRETPEERKKRERSLFKRMKDGDQKAREELIKENLLFVASVAKKYAHNDKDHFLDLIEEGNIGLMTAIEHFDVNMNNTLCSYAVHYIARNIREYMESEKMIYQTNHAKIKDVIDKIRNKFVQTEEREPTTSELLDLINGQTDANILNESDLYTLSVDSIDSGFENDTDNIERDVELLFNNMYCHHNDYEKDIAEESNRDMVEKLIFILQPMERDLIKLYFGVGCLKEHTYYELSEITGYTSERIRQIIDQSIELMKVYYETYGLERKVI